MKHDGPCEWKYWVGALATGLLLVACDSAAPAAPASTAEATSAGPQTGPHLNLTPPGGTLNTQLTLDGSGFPANTQVRIVLGVTGATREPQFIGEVLSNDSGQFRLVLITPRVWSDGSPITDRTLTFSAATLDGGVSTTADYINTAATGESQPATSVAANATTIAMARPPSIALDPASGQVNTRVTVNGSGYPPKQRIEVRIGLPGAGASPQVYGNTVADNLGSFSVAFAIPSVWPNGQKVTEKKLVVIASTAGNVVRALAEYAVEAGASVPPTSVPAATASISPTGLATLTPTPIRTAPAIVTDTTAPASPDPIAASVDFLYSLLRDPSGASSVVYLSERFRTEINNNWVLPTGLGIQPGYSSFEVVLLTRSEDSVVMQATLTYESGASIRNFTLIKEGGNWRIDQVVAGSR